MTISKTKKFSMKGWNIKDFLKGRKKLLITIVGAITGYIITKDPTLAVITGASSEFICALIDYFTKE